jgi:hypothetical protein
MIVDSLSQIMTKTVHDHEKADRRDVNIYPARCRGENARFWHGQGWTVGLCPVPVTETVTLSQVCPWPAAISASIALYVAVVVAMRCAAGGTRLVRMGHG